MRLRIRGPEGTVTINLQDTATVGDLISMISEKTEIANFDTKYGYPPKPLLLRENPRTLPLSELGITLDGEQLTISKVDDEVEIDSSVRMTMDNIEASATTKAGQRLDETELIKHKFTEGKPAVPIALKRKGIEGDVPEQEFNERGTTVVLRVMPDDNSCLFRAFGTAILPGDDKSMTELRSIVASAIQADPETYSKVVLERDPDRYCEWIQTSDAWGGAIEMGILANYFDVEICSIDVQSLRIDRFNEGASTRCILVYSGIHYDTIAESPLPTDPECDRFVWERTDDMILSKALGLCKKLKAKHYYTDTGGMAIRCGDCGSVSYGEAQASLHAQQTGHYDMEEVQTDQGS